MKYRVLACCLTAMALNARADVEIAKSSADFPTPLGGNVAGPLAKWYFNWLAAGDTQPRDVPFPNGAAETSIRAYSSASWLFTDPNTLQQRWLEVEQADPGPTTNQYRTGTIYHPRGIGSSGILYGNIGASTRATRPGATTPTARGFGRVSASNNNNQFRITPDFTTSSESGSVSQALSLVKSSTRDIPIGPTGAGPYRAAFNLDLIPALDDSPTASFQMQAYTDAPDGFARAERSYAGYTNVTGHEMLFSLTIAVIDDAAGERVVTQWRSDDSQIEASPPTLRFTNLGNGVWELDPRDRFISVGVDCTAGFDFHAGVDFGTAAETFVPSPASGVCIALGGWMAAGRRRRAALCC